MQHPDFDEWCDQMKVYGKRREALYRMILSTFPNDTEDPAAWLSALMALLYGETTAMVQNDARILEEQRDRIKVAKWN